MQGRDDQEVDWDDIASRSIDDEQESKKDIPVVDIGDFSNKKRRSSALDRIEPMKMSKMLQEKEDESIIPSEESLSHSDGIKNEQ